MDEERSVPPDCSIAENPFYERVLNGERAKEGGRGEGGRRRKVDPNCVNASNPFHECADYCTKRTTAAKKHGGKGNSGSFLISVLKLSPRSSSKGSDGGKSVESSERFSVEGRNVDPECVNPSNPFHQCAGYCTKKTTDANRKATTGKAVQNGFFHEEVRKKGEGRKAAPICVNVSGPFHQSAESTPDAMRQIKEHTLGALLARECEEEAVSRSSKEEQSLIKESNKVDPRCPNASNPFHVCADYCHKKISGTARTVKRIPDGSKKKMNAILERKDVDPRCVNASNPFHRCSDYCFQNIHRAI